MGDIISSEEEEYVVEEKYYSNQIVVGMTMEQADEFLKTHYVGRKDGTRKTYVANNRHKDRRPERIQVKIDKNGIITEANYG